GGGGAVGPAGVDAPGVAGAPPRLWVATTDARSWAAVDHDGRQNKHFTVWQHGPRRLWDEIEAAHHWWEENNRPPPERFGLTVTADRQWAWLDRPAQPVRALDHTGLRVT
ncbi:methyltransferase, partial [Kitasatospora sp. NPDC048296]